MAAPMPSSEVLPAGISCAVTFSCGCAEFHSWTIALPQAISSGLFDSHTLIGPVVLSASLEPDPPPHAAVIPSARTAADTVRIFDLICAPSLYVRVGRGGAVRGASARGRSRRGRRAAPAAGRRG